MKKFPKKPGMKISLELKNVFRVIQDNFIKMVGWVKTLFTHPKFSSPSDNQKTTNPPTPVKFQPVETLSIGNISDTRHSAVRKQQRGISREQIDTILAFGAHKKCAGKATKVYLDKKGREELTHYLRTKRKSFQLLDKVKNIKLIISEPENQLITVYKG